MASRAAGVSTLADLKGKKIGTMPGTSAGYFVNKLLGTAGLADTDYRVVSGNVCMRTPCGAAPSRRCCPNKQIDAFGIWEPAVELGADALGRSNAVLFQNFSVYREVYSLYSTTEKLSDPATRKNIVAFVRALNQTLDVFTRTPDAVYATVASAVGMDTPVVKAVWPDHRWTGTWGPHRAARLPRQGGRVPGCHRQEGGSTARRPGQVPRPEHHCRTVAAPVHRCILYTLLPA